MLPTHIIESGFKFDKGEFTLNYLSKECCIFVVYIQIRYTQKCPYFSNSMHTECSYNLKLK